MAVKREPVVFTNEDLELQEVPVTIGDKNYILREASGAAGRQYQNAILNRTTLGENGRPSKMTGLADVEPLLVSLCLYRTNEAGEATTLVPLKEISTWNYKIVKKLHTIASELSDLNEAQEQETVKNEQGDMEDGSS